MTSPAPPCPPLYLPRRLSAAHKGDFGHALLVGGSRGMAGSISLSAIAAMRTGSGLVTVLVPDRCLETVAGFEPGLMTIAAPDTPIGQFDAAAMSVLEARASKADAIGIGPGMGTGTGAVALVSLTRCLSKVPRVFDADALNILAQSSDDHEIQGPAILTPHPGEMQRLTGAKASDRAAQIEAAVELAASQNVVVLLKGAPTFITDGRQRWLNPTGNPGMAKGGSGDCLTGILTSLLGQGLSPYDAAILGAYVHGYAGDLAAKHVGQAGMLPSDLIHHLPAAIEAVTQSTLESLSS